MRERKQTETDLLRLARSAKPRSNHRDSDCRDRSGRHKPRRSTAGTTGRSTLPPKPRNAKSPTLNFCQQPTQLSSRSLFRAVCLNLESQTRLPRSHSKETSSVQVCESSGSALSCKSYNHPSWFLEEIAEVSLTQQLNATSLAVSHFRQMWPLKNRLDCGLLPVRSGVRGILTDEKAFECSARMRCCGAVGVC